MNKISGILLFLVFFSSCKTEKKEPVINKETVVEIQEEKEGSKLNFKLVNNLLDNPNLQELSIQTHAFDSDIIFDGMYVLKTAEDTYSFILLFDEDKTNFEAFSKWKLAIIATAKDPLQFESELEQKKGARTTGVESTPVMMGDYVVLLTENFKLKPKEFSFIRFYLYNFNKETNTKYYLVKDVVLP